jgi:hypothetical protein
LRNGRQTGDNEDRELTDSNAVKEQRPGVADNPTVLGDTPRSGKHQKTDEHDGGILDKTPPAADPAFRMIRTM